MQLTRDPNATTHFFNISELNLDAIWVQRLGRLYRCLSRLVRDVIPFRLALRIEPPKVSYQHRREAPLTEKQYKVVIPRLDMS
jgi:hypothetical protein